jgi:hypothetical protein
MFGGNPRFLREESYFATFHKKGKPQERKPSLGVVPLREKTLASYKMQL